MVKRICLAIILAVLTLASAKHFGGLELRIDRSSKVIVVPPAGTPVDPDAAPELDLQETVPPPADPPVIAHGNGDNPPPPAPPPDEPQPQLGTSINVAAPKSPKFAEVEAARLPLPDSDLEIQRSEQNYRDLVQSLERARKQRPDQDQWERPQ